MAEDKPTNAEKKDQAVPMMNSNHCHYNFYPGQEATYVAPPPPYYSGPTQASTLHPQPVVLQPHGGYQYVSPIVTSQAVPDHLIYAVMATICCCWPIGLFAVFKSIECRNAINRGDLNQAVALSRQTRCLSNWAIGVGILFVVLSLLLTALYVWLTITHYHRH
jgi:hypothetical protein